MEPGHAMHAESIGDTGDARNWGDVSRGAFMAREGSDGSRAARNPKMIPVMPQSGQITTLLDGGIAVGSLVGVDLRTDTGTERVDRDDVVTSAHRPARRERGAPMAAGAANPPREEGRAAHAQGAPGPRAGDTGHAREGACHKVRP